MREQKDLDLVERTAHSCEESASSERRTQQKSVLFQELDWRRQIRLFLVFFEFWFHIKSDGLIRNYRRGDR